MTVSNRDVKNIAEILTRVNAELIEKDLGRYGREVPVDIQDEAQPELTYYFEDDEDYAS